MRKLSADAFLDRLFPVPAEAPLLFPPDVALSMPLLDVRSPCEFAHSHLPGAVNFPLFSDEERARLGVVYKESGREEATRLGFAFVGPRLGGMAQQLSAIAGKNGSLALYCSRGGMRSSSVAWLCNMLGLRGMLLAGGYKAFRRHVLRSFETKRRLLVLGGHTGAGKTVVLHRLAARGEQVIDLEGLAAHRGSAFGSWPDKGQPSTANFENLLSLALSATDPARPLWVEDESENLGTVNVPFAFFRQMREAPVVVLEVPRETRLARALSEYGRIERDRIALCLERIKKRLGGVAHKQASAHLAAGDMASLASLLLDYYDRAYDKQLARRPPAARVQAGTEEEAAGRLQGALRMPPHWATS